MKTLASCMLIAALATASNAQAQVCTPSTIALCVRPPNYVGPTVVMPDPVPSYAPPSYSPCGSGPGGIGCSLGGLGAGIGPGFPTNGPASGYTGYTYTMPNGTYR